MEVIIQPDRAAAARLVAKIISRELQINPGLVLGLATGATMEQVYQEIVRLHKTGKLDFSRCCTFNLDEYVGLAASNPNSYRHYMDEHLFRHVNIDWARTHLPDGMAVHLEGECMRYEALIQQCGGVDL